MYKERRAYRPVPRAATRPRPVRRGRRPAWAATSRPHHASHSRRARDGCCIEVRASGESVVDPPHR